MTPAFGSDSGQQGGGVSAPADKGKELGWCRECLAVLAKQRTLLDFGTYIHQKSCHCISSSGCNLVTANTFSSKV
eukprot:204483-Amphidinium_carterae.1